MTYGALENYILKFAAAQPGITVSGGLFFTVMAVLLFLSRVTIGKLADKRGEALFVYSCNGLMLAALLLLALVPGNVTFLIAAALSGYAFGGIEPALQSMAVHTAPPQRRGAANSTFLCAYDIGIGLGGGLAGLLIDRVGYGSMFGVIAVANVLSVAVYVLWGRRHASSMTRAIGNEFVKMIFVSFLNSNIYLLKKRLTSRVGIFLETPYSKASSHFPIASH